MILPVIMVLFNFAIAAYNQKNNYLIITAWVMISTFNTVGRL